jgi:NAD(P)-dependent dehydrogenase (short-subunit alcohol dehydrogenase family)
VTDGLSGPREGFRARPRSGSTAPRAVTGAGGGIGLPQPRRLAQAGAAVTLSRAPQRRSRQARRRSASWRERPKRRCSTSPIWPRSPAFFSAVRRSRPGQQCRHEPADADDGGREADYDAVLDLNVKAAFFVAQACARR